MINLDKLSFDDLMNLKCLSDDIASLGNNTHYNRARRLSVILFANGGIREFVTNVKLNLAEFHDGLNDILAKYKTLSGSKTENVADLVKECDDLMMKAREKVSSDNTKTIYLCNCTLTERIGDLIATMRSLIRRCDQLYVCAQTAFKIESQTESKYKPATAKSIVSEYVGGPVSYADGCGNVVNGPDPMENMSNDSHVVCKNIKAAKNDFISLTNKYFGKNSEFKDLDVMSKIL